MRGIPRKVTTTYMAEGDVAKKVTVDVSTNKLLIQEFLNGDYCVHGVSCRICNRNLVVDTFVSMTFMFTFSN